MQIRIWGRCHKFWGARNLRWARSVMNIDWNCDVFLFNIWYIWYIDWRHLYLSSTVEYKIDYFEAEGVSVMWHYNHDESRRWVIVICHRWEMNWPVKSVKVGLGPNLVTQKISNLLSAIWRNYYVILSHLNDSLKGNSNNKWVMMCEHLEVEEITGVTVEYK